MKLTNRTTPQARNYQCDRCKAIKCHKDMETEKFCSECYDEACKPAELKDVSKEAIK